MAARPPAPAFELVRDDDEDAPRPRRFRLYSAEDLLQLPPPSWLLDGHLVEGSLAVLYGPPGGTHEPRRGGGYSHGQDS